MGKEFKQTIKTICNKKVVKKTIFFIVGLIYALILILRTINNVGVQLYSKLNKTVQTAIIYVLIGLSIMQLNEIKQKVFIKEVKAEEIAQIEEIKVISFIQEEAIKVDTEIQVKEKQPTSNKQAICLTLKKQGYDNEAVAGIMLNIQKESNFNPNSVNSIGCSGIAQWCFGRKERLKNTYGNNWNDVNNQLTMLTNELQNSYTRVNNYLKAKHSFEDKAEYFCNNFEVPGQSICSNRRYNASQNKELLNYVNNNCEDK